MPFRASTVIPADAYDSVKREASALKTNAESAIKQMQSGTVGFSFVVTVVLALKEAQDTLTSLASTPGLVAYARDQEDDPAYDVTAEFQALLVALNATLVWVDQNLPRSVAVSDPLSWTGPNVVTTSFAPGATAGFRTVLTGVVDAIA